MYYYSISVLLFTFLLEAECYGYFYTLPMHVTFGRSPGKPRRGVGSRERLCRYHPRILKVPTLRIRLILISSHTASAATPIDPNLHCLPTVTSHRSCCVQSARLPLSVPSSQPLNPKQVLGPKTCSCIPASSYTKRVQTPTPGECKLLHQASANSYTKRVQTPPECVHSYVSSMIDYEDYKLFEPWHRQRHRSSRGRQGLSLSSTGILTSTQSASSPSLFSRTLGAGLKSPSKH